MRPLGPITRMPAPSPPTVEAANAVGMPIRLEKHTARDRARVLYSRAKRQANGVGELIEQLVDWRVTMRRKPWRARVR